MPRVENGSEIIEPTRSEAKDESKASLHTIKKVLWREDSPFFYVNIESKRSEANNENKDKSAK